MSKRNRNYNTESNDVVEVEESMIDQNVIDSVVEGTIETNDGEAVAGLITTDQVKPVEEEATKPAYDVKELLTKYNNSKSAVVRELHTTYGLATKDIVKAMNEAGVTSKNGNPFIYQHARNILNQKLKGAN